MLSAAVTAIEHAFPGKNNMLYIMSTYGHHSHARARSLHTVTGIYVLGFGELKDDIPALNVALLPDRHPQSSAPCCGPHAPRSLAAGVS